MFEMKMDMLLLNVHGQGLELTPDPWRCENDAIDKSKAIYVQILHAVQNSFFFRLAVKKCNHGNSTNTISGKKYFTLCYLKVKREIPH